MTSTTTYIYDDTGNLRDKRTDSKAINDAVNGFDAKTDSIIEITGYSGNLGALSII
ncbi:MAG: hypothetical protein KME21_09345 [Desmonostoc vinosum HA7617-LM4]|jgi:hypothetical protein|nr:hypothetical protein [Desmonostoc vinosum HA7617-LM4]